MMGVSASMGDGCVMSVSESMYVCMVVCECEYV